MTRLPIVVMSLLLSHDPSISVIGGCALAVASFFVAFEVRVVMVGVWHYFASLSIVGGILVLRRCRDVACCSGCRMTVDMDDAVIAGGWRCCVDKGDRI